VLVGEEAAMKPTPENQEKKDQLTKEREKTESLLKELVNEASSRLDDAMQPRVLRTPEGAIDLFVKDQLSPGITNNSESSARRLRTRLLEFRDARLNEIRTVENTYDLAKISDELSSTKTRIREMGDQPEGKAGNHLLTEIALYHRNFLKEATPTQVAQKTAATPIPKRAKLELTQRYDTQLRLLFNGKTLEAQRRLDILASLAPGNDTIEVPLKGGSGQSETVSVTELRSLLKEAERHYQERITRAEKEVPEKREAELRKLTRELQDDGSRLHALTSRFDLPSPQAQGPAQNARPTPPVSGLSSETAPAKKSGLASPHTSKAGHPRSEEKRQPGKEMS
jgi:hypothetical protein